MKTDRELLELAARAIGLPGGWSCDLGWKIPPDETHSARYWIPLVDDGDAFRLAVKLGLWIHIGKHHTSIEGTHIEETARRSDSLAATRRVIVRAAAEIQLHREKA